MKTERTERMNVTTSMIENQIIEAETNLEWAVRNNFEMAAIDALENALNALKNALAFLNGESMAIDLIEAA